MTIYSRKMQAIFHRAQLEAERFESPFLETWHVLLAMVEVPGSVAYLTFTDFEDRIHSEEIETAAVLAMEKRPKDLSESDIIDLRAQSPALEAMLQEAQGIASVTGAVEVGSEHVLMAFLLHKDLMVCRLLEVAGFQYKDDSDKPRIIDLRRSLERNAGLSKQDLKAIHDLRKPKKSKASANFANMMQPPQSSTGELADYTKDLTALAESGNLDPVIGRDEEISRMIQVLSRKTKNNPVLVGEAGVGKTALALGLAQRIASGEVPFELADMRILELDMMSVVAGTRFRGDFEERMNQIIDEIEADGKIILFIDELHTIIGSGSGIDSTLDAANILKPALARGTLHMVGATTQAEYQKHIEKDAALSRRFAKITIEEPSVSEAIDILNGLRSSYEDYHRVTITDAAVETAVKAAHRYLTSKNLPDSAIDLLDEASATVQVRIKKEAKREITPLDEALISGDIGAAVKQYKAKGPVTDILLPVVALDDAVGLVVFAISFGIARSLGNGAVNVTSVILEPVLEVILSLILGFVMGLLFTLCEKYFHSRSKRMAVSITFVMMTVAISSMSFEIGSVHIGFSSLLACMMLGTVFCNICDLGTYVHGDSQRHEKLSAFLRDMGW